MVLVIDIPNELRYFRRRTWYQKNRLLTKKEYLWAYNQAEDDFADGYFDIFIGLLPFWTDSIIKFEEFSFAEHYYMLGMEDYMSQIGIAFEGTTNPSDYIEWCQTIGKLTGWKA